jgi:hypothetical protein
MAHRRPRPRPRVLSRDRAAARNGSPVRIASARQREDPAQAQVIIAFALAFMRRMLSASDREGMRQVRAAKRELRADPTLRAQLGLTAAPRAGRPRGATSLTESDAILFALVDGLRCRPAEVLRAIGADPSSGSKDYAKLKRRVNAFRQEAARSSDVHAEVERMLHTFKTPGSRSASDLIRIVKEKYPALKFF